MEWTHFAWRDISLDLRLCLNAANISYKYINRYILYIMCVVFVIHKCLNPGKELAKLFNSQCEMFPEESHESITTWSSVSK